MTVACPSLIAAFGPTLCRSVDIYCERTSSSFFAEPLNAISNFAFIVAGWAAWREVHKRHAYESDHLLAAIVAFIPIVGIGSFTYHTLATQWASWADVIPIQIFTLLYLWLAMRRFIGLPQWLAALALLAFLLSTIGMLVLVPVEFLWGGAMYLPTVVAFAAIVLGPVPWFKGARQTMLVALALFLFAFTFRTLDMPVCSSFPIGTHYMWHLLNAFMLYLLVRAAVLQMGTPFADFHRSDAGGNRIAPECK